MATYELIELPCPACAGYPCVCRRPAKEPDGLVVGEGEPRALCRCGAVIEARSRRYLDVIEAIREHRCCVCPS